MLLCHVSHDFPQWLLLVEVQILHCGLVYVPVKLRCRPRWLPWVLDVVDSHSFSAIDTWIA